MTRYVAAVILVLVFFVSLGRATAEQRMSKERARPIGEAFTVHGRLGVYNGTPSCRVWVVGTKRILGIRETETECPIPFELLQILKEDINDRWVYGDFTVVPLTKYREGTMQIVTLETAKKLVVTTRKGRLLRKVENVTGTETAEPLRASDRQ